MRFLRAIKEYRELPLLIWFGVGLVFSFVVIGAGGQMLLDRTGLLDESSLYRMKYTSLETGGFGAYVLGKRLGKMFLLILIASTYLGVAAMCAYTAWLGFSLGMILTVSTVRYGLKGIVLTIVMLFPQYLLYVPAYILLLGSGVQLCRSIYFPGKAEHTYVGNKKQEIHRRIVTFLKIFLCILLGGVLESYVNPGLVFGLLKIF